MGKSSALSISNSANQIRRSASSQSFYKQPYYKPHFKTEQFYSGLAYVLDCHTDNIGNHFQSWVGKLCVRRCKMEVVSFPFMKVPKFEFLTCLRVVSRKVPNGFKLKASLSKDTSKRKTAKIFVSRLLELSLQKHRCKCLYIHRRPRR